MHDMENRHLPQEGDEAEDGGVDQLTGHGGRVIPQPKVLPLRFFPQGEKHPYIEVLGNGVGDEGGDHDAGNAAQDQFKFGLMFIERCGWEIDGHGEKQGHDEIDGESCPDRAPGDLLPPYFGDGIGEDEGEGINEDGHGGISKSQIGDLARHDVGEQGDRHEEADQGHQFLRRLFRFQKFFHL
ncbi:hypothetical protein CULT_380018 [[Clostridium] ultunense Esp]|nr:hypothetical protein CULT_380018 [[Clostridium] ultunense Esp]